MGYLELVGPDRIVSNASPHARKDAYTGNQADADKKEMKRLFEMRLKEELAPIEAKQKVLGIQVAQDRGPDLAEVGH